jgi:hypothetical protein
MSNSALNELGFAEFVAKLISDTFDAIFASQVDQKNKMAELYALLAMEREAFIDLCLTDDALLDQLDNQLQDLFGDNSEIGHLVQEGSVYQPETENVAEFPAYKELLNVTLVKQVDYKEKAPAQTHLREPIEQQPKTPSRKPQQRKYIFILLPAGVNKIKRAIMAKIGEHQRSSIASMMSDGIPRLVVDSGKINAKLTFSTELFDHSDDEDQGGPEDYKRPTPYPGVVPRSSTTETVRKEVAEDLLLARRARLRSATQFSLNTSSRFVGSIDTERLSRSRLKISPASNKVPQDVSSKTNIYSEVEIHFKTIL